MRPLTELAKATLSQPHYEFLLLHIGGETNHFFTTAPININHNSNVYVGDGLLVSGDPIPEQADLASGETEFLFADYDRALTNLLLSEGYLNRPVFAEVALLGLDQQLKGTLPFFAGTVSGLDRFSDQDNKREPLVLTAEWLWAAGETPAGRNCSEGSQAAYFPNDKGMEFINDLGKKIPWGRE